MDESEWDDLPAPFIVWMRGDPKNKLVFTGGGNCLVGAMRNLLDQVEIEGNVFDKVMLSTALNDFLNSTNAVAQKVRDERHDG